MKKPSTPWLTRLVVVVAMVGGAVGWNGAQPIDARVPAGKYTPTFDPVFNADNFVREVNNPYFTLTPGTQFSYRKTTKEGLEEIETIVLHETRKILGIKTTVVWDRAWFTPVGGTTRVLVEDTRDWYAQDRDGNVWYFGEAVLNYDPLTGNFLDSHGSWEAGVDGAKAGIIMMADPRPGDSYRQEIAIGIAEDVADVVAVGVSVSAGGRTFRDCLQTRDWSLIEKKANEYKFYCPEVGFVVREERVVGHEGALELVGISVR